MIGTVVNAEIVTGSRGKRGGTYIAFRTSENLKKDDLVRLEIQGQHYFKVTDIAIIEKELLVSARETGYWANALERKDNFDIRNLIDLKVTLITDTEVIQRINKEACWC